MKVEIGCLVTTRGTCDEFSVGMPQATDAASGRVIEIDGNRALVAWEDGSPTWERIDRLEPGLRSIG